MNMAGTGVCVTGGGGKGSVRGLQCNLSRLNESTTWCTEARCVVYSTPPSSALPLPRANGKL